MREGLIPRTDDEVQNVIPLRAKQAVDEEANALALL